MGRGRGGGGGWETHPGERTRVRLHTHTHTHERACVTLSFEYTPPRGSHPGTRPRTVTDTHLQAETPEQHTHQRLFLALTSHGPAGRGARRCPHAGHTQA